MKRIFQLVKYCLMALFIGLFIWLATLEPSNMSAWQTDVAVLAYADIDGDRVTIHNIRHLDYRTEFDYTPRYYDKSYDLTKLDSVDLITSYWMGPIRLASGVNNK